MKQIATFQERLKEVIGDYSYSELGAKVGLSKQAIGAYMTGVRVPKRPTIAAIATVFGVSTAWLCGLDVPKYDNESDDIFSIPGVEPPPRWVRKPLLGNIACGLPILAVENVEEYILIPENIHCDFLLRCKGDSMINARILDGDIVMIRHQEDVENGEIAAVRIDGEVTLKRVYKQPGMVQLVAENPTFPIKVYNNGNCSDFCIVGKAIAFLSLVR